MKNQKFQVKNSQNANLWFFQSKYPHKHYTETWNHPNNTEEKSKVKRDIVE